jgi:hypothetical protein
MPSAREDYLLRMIQQLGVVLARLRERLRGARTEEAGEIEREAGAAIATLLGPQSTLLGQVDAGTAVRLVGSADRVATWVAFLRVQAEAYRLSGRTDTAWRLAARADAIERSARELWREYGDG